jgi:serine/threonine protein kinase
MSMTQTTTEVMPSGDPHCQYCGIQLPPQATFCTSCGERVIKKQVTSLLQDNQDIATSYRITSLVRRRAYVSLFLATDIRQQRPVALRDIDITSLDNEERSNAADAVQHEYDLLRRQHIPYVIPLIDVRHFQGHLYVVAGWPRDTKNSPNPPVAHNTNGPLHTLQDILQSGKGLPEESLALTWIEHLCQALHVIHTSGIVVADMDPQTIVLNGDTYASELALMVSWLPPSLRTLFPHTSTIANTTNYTAPEVLMSKPEPRSDIYSLGALLYLLLTGTPPEEPVARTQRRLRLPGELNSRIGTSLDDFIMQALALDAADRFSTAIEMHEALIQLRTGGKRTGTAKESLHRSKANSTTNATNTTSSPDNTGNASIILPTATEETLTDDTFDEQQSNELGSNSDAPDYEQRIEKIVSTDTVLITPLSASSHQTWQSSPTMAPATPTQIDPAEGIIAETPLPANLEIEIDEQDKQDELHEDDLPGFAYGDVKQNTGNPNTSIGQHFKRHITGLLPAIPRSVTSKAASKTSAQNSNIAAPVKPLPVTIKNSHGIQPKSTSSSAGTSSFFKQLQRIFLGEQKQTTTAAAIVETPLRVQPNQHYQIRIHVMGRNWPMGTLDSKDGAAAGGLSSLVEGDLVSIEVRSALYQNYAYVVQQATVQIPENGYAAEVTIPMHPLSQGPSGRRDRLHIFFMDEKRRSLYEKPFVIELFISHLVQPGREGHNVLTIPF